MENVNWLEVLANLLFASAGGIVSRLAEKEKSPRKIISLGMYIGSAGISLFVGGMAYALCQTVNFPFWMGVFITASCGFGGAPVIHLFADIRNKKLGIEGGSEDE